MGSILIRGFDHKTKRRLRDRATRHGRSVEQEVREILKDALASEGSDTGRSLDAIRRPAARFSGVALPTRGPEKESWLSGIFAMAGVGRAVFAGEDPDDYVRRMRQGWE